MQTVTQATPPLFLVMLVKMRRLHDPAKCRSPIVEVIMLTSDKLIM